MSSAGLFGFEARHAELIWYKSYADLRAEVERTYIGFLWWIIEPLMNMFVFYIVFGLIMQQKTPNYVPFLLIGLVAWKWQETAVRVGANSILANTSLMRQVHIPKVVFPTVTILTNAFKFLVAFLVLIIFLWIDGFPLNKSYLALPIMIGMQYLIITAMTYPLCALTPFFPDISILLDNIMRVLFFLSGVFYDASNLTGWPKYFFSLNPISKVFHGYREILLDARWPDFSGFGFISAGCVAVIALGWFILKTFDRTYPRIVNR